MEQSPRFHSMPQPIECHSCNFDKDFNSKKTKTLLTNILKKNDIVTCYKFISCWCNYKNSKLCAITLAFFFLQLTKQIEELTAERTKLMKTLTVLREKFDATVAENSKRGNLIQDLKEEVKVNFLANQVSF